MPDTPNDGQPHRRPHTPPLDAPYHELDLARELELLHHEPEWRNGQNARTLVKHEDLRIVLMALKAQARIPEHQARGRIAIQTIRGRIHVRAEGRTFDLPAGTLLTLGRGLRHSVEAIEESAFLLTIALPTEGGPRGAA